MGAKGAIPPNIFISSEIHIFLQYTIFQSTNHSYTYVVHNINGVWYIHIARVHD